MNAYAIASNRPASSRARTCQTGTPQMGAHRTGKSQTGMSQTGMSLIEVLVAMVIIGILAAVANTSYRGHIIKSNRAAAQAVMLDASQHEQQVLLNNRAYTAVTSTANLTTIGITPPSKVAALYDITVTVTSSPPAFTVTATPITGTVQAGDDVMTLTSAGVKTPASKW